MIEAELSGGGEGGMSSWPLMYSSSGGISERWRGVVAVGGTGVVVSTPTSFGDKGMRVRLPVWRTLTRTGYMPMGMLRGKGSALLGLRHLVRREDLDHR